MRVYENVFSLSHPSALASPAGIHVAYWANEERLFQLCSLLSMPKLGLKLRDDLFNLSISFDEGTAANAASAASVARSPGRRLRELLTDREDGPPAAAKLLEAFAASTRRVESSGSLDGGWTVASLREMAINKNKNCPAAWTGAVPQVCH